MPSEEKRAGGCGAGEIMEDLSLHIMDVVENAITGGATVVIIRVEEDPVGNELTIAIQDNGEGMDMDQVEQALDPFYTTKQDKRVGLGLPMFRQSAVESGGSMDVISKPGVGTVVQAVFGLDHPDRKPLGDIEGTVKLLQAFHPEVIFSLEWE